ncbi:MAG: hypothetical protein KBH04_09035, partial [Roseburia sp.]|nr:hypothetical protein [Roseburia sp.]
VLQGLRETDEELRTQTGILPAICNRQILKSDDPVAKKPPAHPNFLFIPQKSHPTSDAFAAKQMWGFYFPDKSKFI